MASLLPHSPMRGHSPTRANTKESAQTPRTPASSGGDDGMRSSRRLSRGRASITLSPEHAQTTAAQAAAEGPPLGGKAMVWLYRRASERERKKKGKNSAINSQRSSNNSSIPHSGWRFWVACLVRHRAFDILMCLIVVVNAITIGLEQTYRLQQRSTSTFDNLEHAFLSIFILELALNFCDQGLAALGKNWIRMDLAIVISGVLTNWVLAPLGDSMGKVNAVLVLRMTRLLRLARTLRLVVRCRELLMLVQGLLNSVSTMFHTLVLCIVILYVLGCMSLELIPLSEMNSEEGWGPLANEVISSHFRSLPLAMLTLVQFITFDNVVYIYKPLIEADGTLAIFFMAVILVVGVVFMNLVTAIIVNSAVEQAMQDRDVQRAIIEAKRKKLVVELREAFTRADTDDSGKISKEELEDIDPDDKELLVSVLGIADLEYVFDSLDVDGEGEIAIEEFCTGVERIATSQVSLEFKRMERMVQSVHEQVRAISFMQEELRQHLAGGEASADLSSTELSRPPSGRTNKSMRAMPPRAITPLPMPSWVAQLTLELREACSCDVRSAMEEACAAFMDQVCDGTMEYAATPPPPELPNGKARECIATLDETSWEALPELSPRSAVPPAPAEPVKACEGPGSGGREAGSRGRSVVQGMHRALSGPFSPVGFQSRHFVPPCGQPSLLQEPLGSGRR